MKVHVVGGTTVKEGAPGYQDEVNVLGEAMGVLGPALCSQGHEVVVCSPFPDSADFHLLQAIAKVSVGVPPTVYYPEFDVVERELKRLLTKLNMVGVRRFPCRTTVDPTDAEGRSYSWLLAQLSAMDASAAVIVVGGRPSASLNLLLSLAAAKNKAVLPLTFLGGAARDYHDANVWSLRDLLLRDIVILDDLGRIEAAPKLLDALRTGPRTLTERSFFISYSRARPHEADYVEALLRRRDRVVYRDEEEFEPSADTPSEIVRNIKRAGVFVALWCREYACSPWCFDELELAIERHAAGHAELWILCLDETRIVPKAARTLNHYLVDSREKLEAKVLFLLAKLDERVSVHPGLPASAVRCT